MRLKTRLRVALLLIGMTFAVPHPSLAQSVDDLRRLADDAAARGLPAAPISNKIREGLAKGVPPQRIELVVRQMTLHLENADRMVREMYPATGRPARDAAVTLLAESFGSGMTFDEVRELNRQSQASGKPPISADDLASAAKGLSFIKEAKLSVADGTGVIVEGMKQGFLSHQILDLGREVKRREGDYRTGRASLRDLRDAIARGDRPEQLFRERRVEPVERPATMRPGTAVERPNRPEAPQRPQPVERPQRPEQRQQPR
ncbi:MAG TPA: hypothetical protein VJM31_12465 [Vicinamibacterales bacterium]|nr:hypothetical protein [Vicinamibacterales bacterium]